MNTYYLVQKTDNTKENYIKLTQRTKICSEYRRLLVEMGRKHINDKHYRKYIDKQRLSSKDEQWFLDQIAICDQKLEQASHTNIMFNKNRRKLEDWQNLRKLYVINLSILAYRNHCVRALKKINRIIYGYNTNIIFED